MESKITLKTKFNGKKTVIDEVYFTPPYKIISPLYQEDNTAEIVVLSSSAGLLGGDRVEMELGFGAKSNAKITSQSYEKVFNTDGKKVVKTANINVQEDAVVKYMPHPTILFEDSDYENIVNVNLTKSSRFYYSDIFNCGRVFMGEQFLMKKFKNYLRINIEESPVMLDHIVLDPKRWDYGTIGLWHGYTHNGLLYMYQEGRENEFVDLARALGREMIPEFEVGVSSSKKGVCVRVLGDNGSRIVDFFEKIVGKTEE